MRRGVGWSPELLQAAKKIEELHKDAEDRVARLTADLDHQDEVLKDLVAERGRTHDDLKTAKVERSGYHQALTRLQQF